MRFFVPTSFRMEKSLVKHRPEYVICVWNTSQNKYSIYTSMIDLNESSKLHHLPSFASFFRYLLIGGKVSLPKSPESFLGRLRKPSSGAEVVFRIHRHFGGFKGSHIRQRVRVQLPERSMFSSRELCALERVGVWRKFFLQDGSTPSGCFQK